METITKYPRMKIRTANVLMGIVCLMLLGCLIFMKTSPNQSGFQETVRKERSQYPQEKDTLEEENQEADELQSKLKYIKHALTAIKEEKKQLQLDINESFYAKKLLSVNYKCNNVVVWGGNNGKTYAGSGAKRICFDKAFKPTPGNCLVYSFGINEEWSFDNDAERYGCEVYSFDPSLMRKTSNITDHIHFFDIGLSDRRKTKWVKGKVWPLMGYQDIVKMLGHEGRIVDVLKMDIECSEWDALPEMLQDGSFDKVKQLQIEIHHQDQPYTQYLILEAMDLYGLKTFDTAKVNCKIRRRPCAEVSYVNTKFL